jgi:hypothetical protein
MESPSQDTIDRVKAAWFEIQSRIASKWNEYICPHGARKIEVPAGRFASKPNSDLLRIVRELRDYRNDQSDEPQPFPLFVCGLMGISGSYFCGVEDVLFALDEHTYKGVPLRTNKKYWNENDLARAISHLESVDKWFAERMREVLPAQHTATDAEARNLTRPMSLSEAAVYLGMMKGKKASQKRTVARALAQSIKRNEIFAKPLSRQSYQSDLERFSPSIRSKVSP